MTEYVILNVLIMLLAVMLAAAFRFRGLEQRSFLVTLAVMLALTAIFDSFIVGLHIVSYVQAHILGIYIGKAPIEDFAYTVTAAFLMPVIWHVMKGRYVRKDH